MTRDIVDRLREQSEWYSDGLGPLCGEAADEIERLRYELETVRLSLVADVKRIEEMLGEVPCDSKKLQPTPR